MLIKLKPEDFVVEEVSDFEPLGRGRFSVYELRKRKVDTFEAIRRIASKSKLPLNRFKYVGLKDRQAITTQLISVEGRVETTKRIPGVKLRYLGRSKEHLGASNLRGNIFTIVVRDLSRADLEKMEKRLACVQAHGLINYFDDQRFGTVVAGQGLPGRFLVLGDYEAALKAMVATPGLRDPLSEKKFKHLISKRWGEWEELSKRWGGRRGAGMIRHLTRRPGDFRGALRNYPGQERAIHVFAYQSLIWNRSVGLYLESKAPKRQRSTTPYVAGQHVWLDYGVEDTYPPVVETFPLMDHTVQPSDPDVRAAVEAALGEEGLTIEEFRIKKIRGCFLRHYERPLRVWPQGLKRIGGVVEDDRRPGKLKVKLRFQLQQGAYASLLMKRLFGGAPKDATLPGGRRREEERPEEERRNRREEERPEEERKRKRKEEPPKAPKTPKKKEKGEEGEGRVQDAKDAKGEKKGKGRRRGKDKGKRKGEKGKKKREKKEEARARAEERPWEKKKGKGKKKGKKKKRGKKKREKKKRGKKRKGKGSGR